MPKRFLPLIALAGALASTPALATDSVFGNFAGRPAAQPAGGPGREPDLHGREQETRNLRREYWEREKARLARSASNRAGRASTEVADRGLAVR